MKNIIFKNTITISLLSHLAVFTIFSFSFGNNIPGPHYADISFLGAILNNASLTPFTPAAMIEKPINADLASLGKNKADYNLSVGHCLKPLTPIVFNTDRIGFTQKGASLPPALVKKEPVVTLHPQLPYNFLLYFQDRQVVHIELMFNVISVKDRSSLLIKRRISSGNLEADLLSMRYMSHYLSAQQTRFTPNKWQSVKIDLSANE